MQSYGITYAIIADGGMTMTQTLHYVMAAEFAEWFAHQVHAGKRVVAIAPTVINHGNEVLRYIVVLEG